MLNGPLERVLNNGRDLARAPSSVPLTLPPPPGQLDRPPKRCQNAGLLHSGHRSGGQRAAEGVGKASFNVRGRSGEGAAESCSDAARPSPKRAPPERPRRTWSRPSSHLRDPLLALRKRACGADRSAGGSPAPPAAGDRITSASPPRPKALPLAATEDHGKGREEDEKRERDAAREPTVVRPLEQAEAHGGQQPQHQQPGDEHQQEARALDESEKGAHGFLLIRRCRVTKCRDKAACPDLEEPGAASCASSVIPALERGNLSRAIGLESLQSRVPRKVIQVIFTLHLRPFTPRLNQRISNEEVPCLQAASCLIGKAARVEEGQVAADLGVADRSVADCLELPGAHPVGKLLAETVVVFRPPDVRMGSEATGGKINAEIRVALDAESAVFGGPRRWRGAWRFSQKEETVEGHLCHRRDDTFRCVEDSFALIRAAKTRSLRVGCIAKGCGQEWMQASAFRRKERLDLLDFLFEQCLVIRTTGEAECHYPVLAFHQPPNLTRPGDDVRGERVGNRHR